MIEGIGNLYLGGNEQLHSSGCGDYSGNSKGICGIGCAVANFKCFTSVKSPCHNWLHTLH